MKSDLEGKFLELLRKPVKSKSEIQEMENIRKELETELRNEVLDLISELKNTGLKFEDVWDLVNTKEPYPKAIPILINHLPKAYHEKNKEGIIRALAVKEAQNIATPALFDEFHRIPKSNTNLRWAIGNTIEAIVTQNDIEGILKIVLDKENGLARQMFIMALGKLQSVKAENALKELTKDKEVAIYALKALKARK